MGKKKVKGKKRPQPFNPSSSSGWSTLPWRPLGVKLGSKRQTALDRKNDDAEGTDAPFDEETAGYNHYDDPHADWSELYGGSDVDVAGSGKKEKKRGGGFDDDMEGADDPGILVGLEVVDGSMYELKKEAVEGGEITRVVPRAEEVGVGNSPARKKESKKRKKQDGNDDVGTDSGDGGGSDDLTGMKRLKEIEQRIRRLKRKAKRRTKRGEKKLKGKQEKAKNNNGGEASKVHVRMDQEGVEEIWEEIRRLNLEKAELCNKPSVQPSEKKRRTEAQKGDQKEAANDNDGEAFNAQTRPQGKTNPKKTERSDSCTNDKPGGGPEPSETDLDVGSIQTAWSVAAPGVYLHRTLCKGLAAQNFTVPTPIQSSTLPASILGRRDVVGAAPTGSGKTLAYALPVLQAILEGRDGAADGDKKDARVREPLTGIVLCPTRELAMQVTAEIKKVGCDEVAVGTIVGGLAEQKQKRILDFKRPPVLVATPGRLWELMSSGEHAHLADLTQLRYLIIDEADRMIRQGSFPQLAKIFDAINMANPPLTDVSLDDARDKDDEGYDPDRLRALQGVPGEAKVTMLDDRLLAMLEHQQNGEAPEPRELTNEEYLEQQRAMEDAEQDTNEEDNGSDEEELPEPVHRQTFVFSATLTLPPSSHHSLKAAEADAVLSPKSKKRGGKKRTLTVEGAIAEILEKAGARGQTKVVDLTTESEDEVKAGGKAISTDVDAKTASLKSDSSSPSTKLPPGLSLHQVKCTQMHKDMHLYAYLTTTKQGSSGPALVFCNSIAAVRRVGETLRVLGLPVRTIHAQMTQKARISALESIHRPDSRSIVVATDVAARGLDIASVATVVHYDVARAIDTFIHRSGRTARGVGEKAVGASISLVAPSEEKAHRAICEAVHGHSSAGFDPVAIDGRLLSAAQERTLLAARVVSCEEVQSKASKKNKWFIEAAEDAGLDLDEDLLDGGLLDGDHRDRQRLSEARKAKARLRELLAKPMRTQQFGKFLSGAGIKAAIQAEAEVKPYLVREVYAGKKGSKKRKVRRS